MDIAAISKRSFEILDLAHEGKALGDDGAPPVVAKWRVEQLEEALREAERVEQAHAEGKIAARIASAKKDIEETIAEIDRLGAQPQALIDRVVRYGVPVTLAWTAATCAAMLVHYGFVLAMIVPLWLVLQRLSQAGRDAIERRRHALDLPFRLRLAWDKLAASEIELQRVRAGGDKRAN